MTKRAEGNLIEVQLDTRGGIMRTSYPTSGGELCGAATVAGHVRGP